MFTFLHTFWHGESISLCLCGELLYSFPVCTSFPHFMLCTFNEIEISFYEKFQRVVSAWSVCQVCFLWDSLIFSLLLLSQSCGYLRPSLSSFAAHLSRGSRRAVGHHVSIGSCFFYNSFDLNCTSGIITFGIFCCTFIFVGQFPLPSIHYCQLSLGFLHGEIDHTTRCLAAYVNWAKMGSEQLQTVFERSDVISTDRDRHLLFT